ncbi:MAG: RNase adapter RapZ [Candidatus Binatus sp.]|nr:RNase adapter RapZ [Candidatus Binatus sp.]MDO8432641.1 RNase adapter RapZ [Candidatus Binatus sp.]
MPATPRLIIVTGVSGSGRLSAMRVLEDLGFYCVDNLPVALAPNVLELAAGSDPALKGVALGIDARERLFFPHWPRIFAELEASGIRPEVIFLDAADDVLTRRYSETRRPHPMAQTGATVAESIRIERLALAEIRERANRLIDTTALTVHELREVVTAAVLGSGTGSRMVLSIISFGYKYGLPVGMDLVLDVRFIPNPFFVPELKPLTGLDPRVREYVLEQPEARRFVDEVSDLLAFLIPLYQREGKSYLTIGLGCTGGRHRSPVLARELIERLRAAGFEGSVRDHDIAH